MRTATEELRKQLNDRIAEGYDLTDAETVRLSQLLDEHIVAEQKEINRKVVVGSENTSATNDR